MKLVGMRDIVWRTRASLPLVWLLACLAASGVLLGMDSSAHRARTCQILKNIENVHVGDYVLAKNPRDRGAPRPHRVTALPRNYTLHLVHIQVDGGGEVQSTRGHPFWVQGRGWTEASNLRAGDVLLDDRDRPVRVSNVAIEYRTTDTYNLTVDGVHTYYVLAGDVPLLVHNMIVVTPGGTAIPVPTGAGGPLPVRNGHGFQFTGGSGGYGMSPKCTNVRVMEPKPGFPNGYVNYSNAGGQSIDQYTGKTVSKSNPAWHQPCR